MKQPDGNPKHLCWLAEGVFAWNQRRQAEPFTPDLRGFDINIELRKVQDLQDFDGVDLTGVDMHGARLQGTSLQRCILDGSDFRSADLTGSDLTYTSIVGANFDGAILKDATMEFAKCMRTSFSYGILRDAIHFNQLLSMIHRKNDSSFTEIAGVSDLLNELMSLHKRLKKPTRFSYRGAHRMFYRGMSVHSWRLTPTVLRPTTERPDDVESRLLTEFISNNPNEFASDASLLSQLVKAREYGLPTRLLDISSDPLVALFFAVSDEEHDQEDAALHIFAVPHLIMRSFNSDSVAVICAYARLKDADQAMLTGPRSAAQGLHQYFDTLSGDSRFRWNDVMDRLVGEITKEGRSFSNRIDPVDFFRVFVVVPKIDERRLRTQSGAFILSAFHESFEQDKVLESTPGVPLYNHFVLTIKADAKPGIRDELERLNITRESLLSSLEVSAEAIRKRYGFE